MSTTISTALTATVVWTTDDLTIAATGSVTGADGITASGGSLGSLVIDGSLRGTTFRGVVNTGGIGTVTNTGTISEGTGFVNGLSSAQPGTIEVLVNNGTLGGVAGDGLDNSAGSRIDSIDNYGALSGQNFAIVNQGTINSIVNAGTILDRVSNAGVIGSFNNSGFLFGGFTESANASVGTFVNSGTISGDLDFSADTSSSATILDTGKITGTVTLSSSHVDTLTIRGAGVVAGDILAGGGTDVVDLDPGAGKTYAAQGYFGTRGGSLLTAVNIESGAFSIDLLYFGVSSVGFTGADTTLILSNHITSLHLTDYNPIITGFGGGDMISLPDTVANAAVLGANGQLTLTENGAAVAVFDLTGTYTGATFLTTAHGTGTDLTVAYSVASAIGNAASFGGAVQVADTAQNVLASLGGLETLADGGLLSGITLTDANAPALSVTAAQLTADAKALDAIGGAYTLTVTGGAVTADSLGAALVTHIQPVAVTDSAANISKDIDTLQSYAAAGKLSGITLTDSGFGTIALSSTQLSADSAALNDISGNFVVSVAATAANQTIAGSAGHGTTVVFSGTASDYSIAVSGSQVTVTDIGTGRTSVDHLSGITAIQFADQTDIVAQTPGASSVTAGNVTELYAAVFGRLPDVPGLNYYEAMLAANPLTPLTQLAQSFLASPEYANNTSHAYTADTAGDTKFITDMYQNLLGRAPESGAVPYYLDLIAKLTQGVTPGTTGYAAADTLAHAYLLTDISASAEFLNDVTVTGQNPSSVKHWLILTS